MARIQSRDEKEAILKCAAEQGSAVELRLYVWAKPQTVTVTRLDAEHYCASEVGVDFDGVSFDLADVKTVYQGAVPSGPPRTRRR